MYGENTNTIAIPIYTVLPYCVILPCLVIILVRSSSRVKCNEVVNESGPGVCFLVACTHTGIIIISRVQTSLQRSFSNRYKVLFTSVE